MKNNFWLFGTFLTILEDESDTEGRYDLIEGTFTPGIETPLHLHSKYSETLIILEGEFTVKIKGKTETLKPGQRIFIPKGTPHAVACTGSVKSKAITIASPSGFAELIRTVGLSGNEYEQPTTPNNMVLFGQVSEIIGDQLLGFPGSPSSY